MQTDPTPPRRRLRAAVLGAGWLAATAGVAAGAWLAVSAAGDGLGTGQRVLTADQVRARLADVDAADGQADNQADNQADDQTDDQPQPSPDVTEPTPTTSPAGSSADGSSGAGTGRTDGGPTALPPSGGGSASEGSGSGRTGSPRSSAPSVPTAAPVRTSAVATSGGTAAVACQGPVVSLRYATPRDGWTVAVQDRGPDKVEVVFTRTTGDSSGDRSGSGGSGEDHGGGGRGPEATAKATCVGGTPVWETEQH